MVLAAAAQQLRGLELFFNEFALMSGLQLNVAKTVLTPTAPLDMSEVRALLIAQAPGWAATVIAEATKCSGVFGGARARPTLLGGPPSRNTLPALVSGAALGAEVFMSIKAYRVYFVSVLLYAGHLEPFPPDPDVC